MLADGFRHIFSKPCVKYIPLGGEQKSKGCDGELHVDLLQSCKVGRIGGVRDALRKMNVSGLIKTIEIQHDI